MLDLANRFVSQGCESRMQQAAHAFNADMPDHAFQSPMARPWRLCAIAVLLCLVAVLNLSISFSASERINRSQQMALSLLRSHLHPSPRAEAKALFASDDGDLARNQGHGFAGGLLPSMPEFVFSALLRFENDAIWVVSRVVNSCFGLPQPRAPPVAAFFLPAFACA